MVVDGDRDSRRLLSFGLREASFEVSSAETVPQALERLQRARLDAIISEITVTRECDGLELRQRLLAHKGWATVPFVFVSSAQALEQRLRASAVGVEHIVTKPVLLQELVGLLRELVTPAGARPEMEGLANSIALLDTLLLLQTSRKSARVEVDADGQGGALYVRDGVLVDAEMGSRVGSAAFFRLLCLRWGTHEIHYRPVVRARRIAEPLNRLVPRTIERVERWRDLAAALPDLSARCTVDLSQLREPVDRLPWQVRALISLLEQGPRLAAVVEKGDLDDLQAMACLGKLHRRGVLVMAGGAVARPAARAAADPPTAPSPDLSSGAQASGAQASGAQAPGAQAPEAQAPEAQAPEAQAPEAQAPEARGAAQAPADRAKDPTVTEPSAEPVLEGNAAQQELEEPDGERAVRDTVEDRVVAFSPSVYALDARHWIRVGKVLALVCVTAIASVGLYRLFSRPDAATVAAAQAFSTPDARPRAARQPERAGLAAAPSTTAASADSGPATQPALAASWRGEEDYPSLLTRARVLSRFNIRMTKELLERAIEARPEGWEALQDMALVLLIRGRSAEALSHARQAMQIEPDAPYALLVSGVVMQESGRLRDAARAYRRFVTVCPRCRYVQDVRRVLLTMRESRRLNRRARR
jgi:CheY-like chemotaxis protein